MAVLSLSPLPKAASPHAGLHATSHAGPHAGSHGGSHGALNAAPHGAIPSPGPVHDARSLTGAAGLATLLLDGQAYTLRVTRAGKLILTK